MVRVGRKKLWSVSSHVCVQIALWLLVWASLLAIRSAMGLQISIRNQEALVRAPSCLLSAATIDIVNTVSFHFSTCCSAGDRISSPHTDLCFANRGLLLILFLFNRKIGTV